MLAAGGLARLRRRVGARAASRRRSDAIRHLGLVRVAASGTDSSGRSGQDSASEADNEEEVVEGDTGLVSSRLSDVSDVEGDEADRS